MLGDAQKQRYSHFCCRLRFDLSLVLLDRSLSVQLHTVLPVVFTAAIVGCRLGGDIQLFSLKP